MEQRFGWEGDGGLGLRLIAQVLAGKKTATCAPLSLMSEGELAAARAAVGRVVPLVDRHGERHGWVRVEEVFETTYGAPDERLWRGEGYASAEAFRKSHERVWDPFWPEGAKLTDDTTLFVERFTLAEPPRDATEPRGGPHAPT